MRPLKRGDTARVAKVRALVESDPNQWTEWAPNKGYVFRVLVLGTEPRRITADAPILDPFDALRDLGWCPESERDHLRATVDQIRRAIGMPEGSTNEQIATAVEQMAELLAGAR